MLGNNRRQTQHNPFKYFALVCVGITSTFVMGMIVWYTLLLQADWCGKAVGAVEDMQGARPEYAVGGCFNILNQQVEALAWNSHIALGVIALSLFALMILVVAGGRANVKVGKDGLEADISQDDDDSPVQ